ncbi:NAD(P)-binding Rossmann-like domain-containing protein [Halopseudomonas sabulinigri]|uniref:NAD(P)-binding Rossmann-like domain-containing protein n=1 Tax=Halopseudomonas sabulinigri TaxID=472181 RepID=A0A1H1XEV8_9GAMM|nr:NAD(P)-binding protein [Halopseudomonas sabulinigri]SDT07680.1 NAD(P)-binding Rossmann-like domain-containing protein [Halopseudomonas sabulinigri]
MSEQQLQADYLIVGSGAVGMAFADTLLSESDASIIIVDQHQQPGGHWNIAYPFVTLHQPSAFYGVSSRELSKGRKDEVGLNKGLGDLASGAEVLAYFDDVMRHQFLPTGRVQYFPMCNYLGDGLFEHSLTGQRFRANTRKTVDATYLKTSVPANHTPSFSIDPGVAFMPLNDLPKVKQPADNYVVIGGGKTGIDACLWLLEHQVDPERICWIVSRDAWLLDRRNTQPGEEFFHNTIGAVAAQFEAIAQAESVDDLFDRLEQAGVLLRIDQNVKPKMFHGATISQLELAQLRRITNVVRMGRVTHLQADRIVLEQGTIATSSNNLHIDCSASAITNLAIKKVFQGNLITPQTVRSYQPVFSAAFIAHVEACYSDEAEKNRLCSVVPLPNHDTDWIRMMAALMMNQYQWSQIEDLRNWLLANRLDGMGKLVRSASKEDAEKQAILTRMRDNSAPAMMKIQRFLAEIN